MKQYLNEFPTTQAEMAEWQRKYKFDTGAGKWYNPAAQAQQTGYSEIEQSLKDIQSKVPSITADIQSLSSKTDIDTSLAPVVDIDTGSTLAVGNGLSSQFTTQLRDSQKSYENLIKQQEERMKEAKIEKQSYLDKLTGLVKKKEEFGTLDTEALYKKALSEYGLTPEKVQEVQGLVGQITTYSNQIVDLEAKKQAALDRIEGRPGIDIGFMNREQSEASKKYNREISTKAAQAGVINQQIQLQRGLFSDARATAGQIVKLATYDQQQKVADMDWAISTYADLFDIMDKEEKNAWNTAYTLQKDELDRQQTEMTNKLNMLVDAGESGVDLKWDMNYMKDKTLEELTMEYSGRMAGRPVSVSARGISPTASMKEYQYAVAQGYEGSFIDYEKEKKEEAPITYSGKYSEDYLARRAENFINENGNIDWYAVDDLENTDKQLYNDMVVFLQKALELSEEEIGIETGKEPIKRKGVISTVGKAWGEAFEGAMKDIKWLFE